MAHGAALQRCRALLPLLLLCCWRIGTAVAAAGADVGRDSAFIGYSERNAARCSDQLSDCGDRAGDNGCLYDAFTMRTFCPATCSVERCTAGASAKAKVKHKGFATPAATRQYAAAMHAVTTIGNGHWRDSSADPPANALKLSSLGITTNLGPTPAPHTQETVEAAIVYSITHGWNVIDSASWASGGRAEAAVGKALHYLLAGDAANTFLLRTIPPPVPPPYQYTNYRQQPVGCVLPPPGVIAAPPPPPPPAPPPPLLPAPPTFVQQRPLRADITRDMLFLSTKAGYLHPRLLQSLLQAGSITPSDIAHGRHCMHPRCLEASLSRSLDRMGLETLDLLFLHDAAEEQLELLGRPLFLARLLEAFRFLESARADGLIRSYGLSTWDCFRSSPSGPRYLPLAEVVHLAELAGGANHGFKYLQLPGNVMMPEAWAQRGWQARRGEPLSAAGPTLSELAAELRLGVFLSAPLMADGALAAVTGGIDDVPELRAVPDTAGKLLQLARSAPGAQAALVGGRAAELVVRNVAVAAAPTLGGDEFQSAAAAVVRAMQRLQRTAPAAAGDDVS